MGFISHIEYTAGNCQAEKRRKTSSRMILNTVSYGIVFPVKYRLLRENDDSSVTDMNYTGSLYVYTMTGYEAYYFIFGENGFLESVQAVQ